MFLLENAAKKNEHIIAITPITSRSYERIFKFFEDITYGADNMTKLTVNGNRLVDGRRTDHK